MAEDSRARLIAYLCQAGLPASRAHAVLDVYTHGLAEQIRRDAEAAFARDFSDNRVFRLAGARHAANLIDPEVA